MSVRRDDIGNNNTSNDLEVHCLSYGCNFLVKVDNVNILRAQFEKFERRFRNNEKSYYDLKLPMFIIDCFSELWKLWIDVPDLHKLIDESKFRCVFEDMLRFFHPKESRTKTFAPKLETCDVCAETFELLNNDLNFSYDLHVQTPHHMQMVTTSALSQKKVNASQGSLYCTDSSCNTSVAPVISLPLTEPTIQKCSSLEVPQMNSNTKAEGPRANTPVQRLQASTSMPSLAMTSNSLPSVDLQLPDMNNPFCGVCCRSISTNPAIIKEHLMSVGHRKQEQLMKQCVVVLKSHKRYISLLDRKNFKFICNLCAKVQSSANSLLQHCKSKEHVNKMRDVTKTGNIST